jgi:hypothetical protein
VFGGVCSKVCNVVSVPTELCAHGAACGNLIVHFHFECLCRGGHIM